MQMRSNMQVPVAGQAPRHQGIKHPANPGTKSASRHPEQHHKQHPHGQTAYRNDPLLLFRPPLRQEQELEPAACTPPAASLSRPRLAASQFIIILPVFSLSAHYRPSRPSLHVYLFFFAFSHGAGRSSQAAIPFPPPLPTKFRRETSL
ncbi:hypothetical protein LMH87_003825 [Akanthomyces muscarius]|uniref:Uncharacterized protein n=1 Tax=Akanthomyces muscarius TaxID=2231603 RepID=A0A9W8UH08_AKAMU|nr:hypothetical protein LMH87_003825 [Akanthomyces muscarius]KAJ4144958.1 hypothetical protein LMH87_003825 [Akanthomyces muscarius]